MKSADHASETWLTLRDEVNDAWNEAVQSGPDGRPIQMANVAVSLMVMLATLRHPEWASEVIRVIGDGLAEIDADTMEELAHNADLLAGNVRLPEGVN